MSSMSLEVVGALAMLTLVVTGIGVTLGVLFPDRAGWLGRFVLVLCVAEGGSHHGMECAARSEPATPSRHADGCLRRDDGRFASPGKRDRDRVAAAMVRRVRVRSPLPGELIRAARTESFLDGPAARILRRQGPPNRKANSLPPEPER